MTTTCPHDGNGYDHSQCVATQGCDNRQAPGLLICRGHLERLGALLRDIEDQAAVLSAVPSVAIRNGSRGGGLASHRAPARLDVLVHNDPRSRPAGERLPGPACDECWHDSCTDIRTWLDAYDVGATDILSVLDVLHSWARSVREDDERKLSAPDHITVSGERDLLTRQLPWIAAQPWVDEFHTDLAQLLGQLKAANSHRADHPYSKCPRDIDGQLCPGDVWVQDEMQPVWRRYADRCAKTWEQAPGAAVCDTCGAVWATPADKARLKVMVDDAAAEAARPRTEDGRRMLTAQELVAQGYVSSVSNVRVSAHRLGIRAVDGHYDPEWFQGKISA